MPVDMGPVNSIIQSYMAGVQNRQRQQQLALQQQDFEERQQQAKDLKEEQLADAREKMKQAADLKTQQMKAAVEQHKADTLKKFQDIGSNIVSSGATVVPGGAEIKDDTLNGTPGISMSHPELESVLGPGTRLFVPKPEFAPKAQALKSQEDLKRELQSNQESFQAAQAAENRRSQEQAKINHDEVLRALQEMKSNTVLAAAMARMAGKEDQIIPDKTLEEINNYRQASGQPEIPYGVTVSQLKGQAIRMLPKDQKAKTDDLDAEDNRLTSLRNLIIDPNTKQLTPTAKNFFHGGPTGSVADSYYSLFKGKEPQEYQVLRNALGENNAETFKNFSKRFSPTEKQILSPVLTGASQTESPSNVLAKIDRSLLGIRTLKMNILHTKPSGTPTKEAKSLVDQLVEKHGGQ